MQIDNRFTAIWYDTSTWPWTPLTGLLATITIRDKTDNSIVVDDEAMTEIGLGEYDYTYDDMDATKAYSYVMNPNSTSAFVETGFVDPRIAFIDKSVSEIAVWWNPYVEWFTNLKKWIQKIVDKVEEKWEEVKTKIEEEIKTIVIPEQKEPIVNVTTERIDTKEFLKAIKEIKPEVNVTTEVVNNEPILTAIEKIGKLSDIKLPEYREPKEVNLVPIQDAMSEIKSIIEWHSEKLDMIEDYVEDEIEKEKEEEEKEMEEEKEKEEEENLKKPIPTQFTAILK